MEKKYIEGIGELKSEMNSLFGKINISIFSEKYEISIRFLVYDESFMGLTEDMITMAKKCISELNNNSKSIMENIKSYYDDEVKERYEDGFCDYVEMNDYSDLSQVMVPKELFIKEIYKREPNSKVYSGLYFECDWNDEGFAVRFDEQGNVVQMGTGEIIY